MNAFISSPPRERNSFHTYHWLSYICAKKIRVGTKMKIGTRKGENICCGSGGGGVYHPVW
jgi:hypothetical protein